MTSTRKGVVVLEFVTFLRILLFSNNRSIVHFADERWGFKKLVIFCGRHRYMIPKIKYIYRTWYNLLCLFVLDSS